VSGRDIPHKRLLKDCFLDADALCCWHMKQPSSVLAELDDWSILCLFLPQGWQQKAHECGALTRARGIAGPDALLRILLIHIASGCSLAETSVRAEQLGLGKLNPSAVYNRLRSAEEWLRWMAEQMRASLGFTAPKLAERGIRPVNPQRSPSQAVRARTGEFTMPSIWGVCSAISSNSPTSEVARRGGVFR
jgi:hypothetical protein